MAWGKIGGRTRGLPLSVFEGCPRRGATWFLDSRIRKRGQNKVFAQEIVDYWAAAKQLWEIADPI